MLLQQGDILIKKSKGQDIFWLSERLVVEVCNIDSSWLSVVRDRYKKSVSDRFKNNEFLPDTGKSWRWAKTRNGFYYCYDNIPDRKPVYYKSKFGTSETIKEALKQLKTTSRAALNEIIKQQILHQITNSIKNEDIRYYMYNDLVPFSDKKAKELAEALAWCSFVKETYENESFKSYGLKKKKDFLEICTNILQEKSLEGFKVNSAAYLRNKISNFPSTGVLPQRNYLISNKYDNDNARIVGKHQIFDEETGEVFKFDIHEALMYYGFMNPGGSSKEAIRQIYINFYCESIKEYGLEPVAYRTFCMHLGKFHTALKTARERHGKDYYKKSVLSYVPSEKLKYAHSLFAGDGSGTINYKYVDKKGKLRTMKLFVMLISDVSSRQIVGYSFSKKGFHNETTDMMKDAVKMAIKNCDYQTMFEFVSDNHGAFTSAESKEFLNLVFNKVRTIESGNSQANPAETEFRLFKQALKGLKNFSSTSWNVGVEGQANPDYLDIKSLPTYEEAVLQFYDIVNAWNNTPLRDGVKPSERFEIKNPKCIKMDKRILRRIFGNTSKKDISYMRGFVLVTKSHGYSQTDEFLFEIPDFWNTGSEEISKACGYKKNAKVKVVWDLEAADIYTLDNQFIMTCPRTTKASQSHAESTDLNKNALGHHLNRKKNQTESVDEFEQSLMESFDALPYTHEIAFGSNKEDFNGKMLENETRESTVLTKKEINDRDFDESEWI
ncbi:putative transposase IS3 family [Tenacibaculum maritimum]|nr:putative transposase IS3 family [Tenacibaculum maritimum]CAA0192627.1 conserved hypothetical protein [Tenacibaculum maritimum]